jgi:hypothetical protein
MSPATALAAEIGRELRRMKEPRTAEVRALRRA